MPRWLSRSSGSSAIGSTRIDALRVCKIDRTNRDYLGHQSARAFRGHADHSGDTAERLERKPLDRLLIGNDLVVAGGQQAIDTPDPERMFEGDNFMSGADGHARIAFRENISRQRKARKAACAP